MVKGWLRGRDSNPRPAGYGPAELPTALPRDECLINRLPFSQRGKVKLPQPKAGPPLAETALPRDECLINRLPFSQRGKVKLPQPKAGPPLAETALPRDVKSLYF